MLHSILLFLCSLFLITLDAPPPVPAISLAQPNISRLGLELVCVDSFELWQGRLRYNDCLTARNTLYNEFSAIRTQLYAFYTESGGFVPPPDPYAKRWKLPLSRTFGTTDASILSALKRFDDRLPMMVL